MLTEMRRNDRQLTESETKNILTQGMYGVLSICGDSPYGVPLSYIYYKDCLYFHCALGGNKRAQLRHNNQASFCVVNGALPMKEAFSMQYESAMVFGPVFEVVETEKMELLVAFIDKYACDEEYRIKGREYAAKMQHQTLVLKMVIDRMTGKARR